MRGSFPYFVAFLAVVLSLWLGPAVWGGKVLLPLDIMVHSPPYATTDDRPVHNALIGDMLFENLVWKQLQRQALAGGEFPLWNPNNFCGHPLYTTGQTSVC